MKINGWEDERLITDNDIRNRMRNVREKLHTLQANRIYTQQVAEIMKGKTLEFNEATFRSLVEIMGPRYLKSMQNKKDAFNQKFWGKAREAEPDSDFGAIVDEFRDKPFFSLDGEIWTVGEFEKHVKSHPLVFRKRQISRPEFAEQFKLAVVDLIRDYFITKEAYQLGYDQNVFVKNYTNMWYDAMISDYWRNQYLREKGYAGDFQRDYMSAIKQYLNPLADSLQLKYSSEIEINTDLFEEIELTRIDLFVLQSGVPYPVVCPGFPILTTDSKLDYGRKMKD